MKVAKLVVMVGSEGNAIDYLSQFLDRIFETCDIKWGDVKFVVSVGNEIVNNVEGGTDDMVLSTIRPFHSGPESLM